MIKFRNNWTLDVVELDEKRDKKIINVMRKHPDWKELVNL